MAENLTFNLDVDTKVAVQSINTFFATVESGAAQARNKLNSALGEKLVKTVKIEFKDGKLVAKEIESIKNTSTKLQQIQKALNGEIGKTPNELRKQLSILKSLRDDTVKYKKGTKETTTEWKQLTARIREVEGVQKKVTGEAKRTASAVKEVKKATSGLRSGILSSFAARFTLIQTAANLATSAILGVVRGIQDLGATAVRMESLKLQLEAFTGGAEQADAAFKEFARVAANSPFNLEQVANAAKIMMAFGMEADAAARATEQLAVIAAATGGDLNLLARNMGQIVAQGRAYTRDLQQFAIQGIPIWEQLAIATGENVESLKELAKEGKIGGAEVSAAISLMTAEGTKFREVADRMQETFAGRLAAIESAFQSLSLEAINALNDLDKTLGGPISNTMKGFAGLVKNTGNVLRFLAKMLAGATAATMAYFSVLAVASLVTNFSAALAGVVLALKAVALAFATATAAVYLFLASLGPAGWVAIIAALVAGGIAIANFGKSANESKFEVAELRGQIAETAGAVDKLTEAEEEYAYAADGGIQVKLKQYNEAKKQADEYKTKLDAEVEGLKRVITQIEARRDAELESSQAALDAINLKISEEQRALADAQLAVRRKYDDEIDAINDTLAAMRLKHSEEMAALQEMGPEQKKLREMQKKELRDKIRSGELNKMQLQQAKARLESMEQQEKIAKLRKEHAAEEKPLVEELRGLEADRKQAIEDTVKPIQDRLDNLESEKRTIEATIEGITQKYKDQIKPLQDVVDGTKNLKGAVDESEQSILNRISNIETLTVRYGEAAAKVRDLTAAIRENIQARGGGTTETEADLASGGPVRGGGTYTVNEVGKEAFLSAAGKLSMINAPAWGSWKAPGRGTVIPAHLTRQLDIPKGGIDLSKIDSKSVTNPGGTSAMVKAIRGLGAGNTISNNVTIQSTNPTQSANSLMVNLQKIRRMRTRR